MNKCPEVNLKQADRNLTLILNKRPKKTFIENYKESQAKLLKEIREE